MGRLLRTVYLCDYFTKLQFRREIHRVINRGKSVLRHVGPIRH